MLTNDAMGSLSCCENIFIGHNFNFECGAINFIADARTKCLKQMNAKRVGYKCKSVLTDPEAKRASHGTRSRDTLHVTEYLK